MRGSTKGWNCKNFEIYLVEIEFEDLGAATAKRLGEIPTRFTLTNQDVDLAVNAGRQAVKTDELVRTFFERAR